MRLDSRMSRVLHVLIHMHRSDHRMTSQTISKMLGTNPVVVRRTMAGLRNKGYVSSTKGHGGGWKLTCDLSNISLLDIYQAIGSPSLLAFGPSNGQSSCLVEQAVNNSLEDILNKADEMVRKRFGEVSVADLANDFDGRFEKLNPNP